jgi:hypothetical protein
MKTTETTTRGFKIDESSIIIAATSMIFYVRIKERWGQRVAEYSWDEMNECYKLGDDELRKIEKGLSW